MRKSKRFIALLIAMLMVVGSLAACGKKEEKPDNKTPDKQTEDKKDDSGKDDKQDETKEEVVMETITVWSDNAHEKELRDKQIAEFNEGIGKELGINIEYTVYGSNFTDTIKIAAQAGEAPDLFRSDSKWMQEFVDAEYLVAIEDLPGSEDLLSRYSALVANQAHVFNGKTYTLPYNLTTYGFVVNKDLFAASGLSAADYPTTWDEVREVAKKITEASNGQAYGFGIAPSALWTITSFYTMGAGQNIGHYGFDYDKMQFAYSDYNTLIRAIDEIVADGSVIPGYETMDADMLRAQFSAGTIGMLGAASFDVAVYNNQFPAEIDWEVIEIPTFDGQPAKYKAFGNPTNLLVAGKKALEHPEKVLKVLEFFYDDANAAQMYEEGLYIPVRSEAIALASKEPDMKNFSSFASFDEIFTMAPVPDTLIQFEGDTYRDAISKMWTDPAVNDVETIMAEIDAKYNAALEKVDSAKLDLYRLPDGVTVERTR
ncbi:MAG: extracellular solute-binding protein [Clostridiales bacterium]|jgi:multiple sugar transport system substrate-binding protein|nr:extracellular solute-binding protein [Clostridiales bacterium]